MHIGKWWTAIDKLLIWWKSDLSHWIKWNSIQAVAVLILLYSWTPLMMTKCREKKLDKSCTRILWTVSNKSKKQHLTKQQLYGHLPPISQTIQVRHRLCYPMYTPVMADQQRLIFISFVWTQELIYRTCQKR